MLVLFFVARPSAGDSAVCVRCRPHPHICFVLRDGARLPHSRLGCHAAGNGGSESGPRAFLMVVMGDPWGLFKGFEDWARAFSCLIILFEARTQRSSLSRIFCLFLRGKCLVYSYGGEELIWLACLHCGILKALSLSLVRRVSPQLRGRQSDEKTDSFGAAGLWT